MKVEVDTADITALEQQAAQLSTLLTAICSTRPKGVRVTDAMIQGAQGGTVTIDQTDDGIMLRYRPGDP